MEITFRRLVAADAGAYRALRLECLREFPYNFGSRYEVQVALPKLYMETHIESGSDEVFVVGAFEHEKLIGICGLSRDNADYRRHIATVVQMYVQAQYSGQRVGLRLLQALIAEAWKIDDLQQLILQVVTSSPHAIHLYGQAGFEQMGFHKDFMKIGERYEDAVLMILFRGKAIRNE